MEQSTNYVLSIHKHIKLASEKNRSTPKHEDLNRLGFPYGSSAVKFQLFKDNDFNFAVPQKVSSFELPRYLNTEECELIWKDFASNGSIVADIEESNPMLCTNSSSPISFFGDSDFPPLDISIEKCMVKPPSTKITPLPMLHLNSSSLTEQARTRFKADKMLISGDVRLAELFQSHE